MVDVDRDRLVAGVRTAYGLQLALDEEQLTAFLLVDIDLIVRNCGIVFKKLYDLSHPSFTFTFNAGPPSLTRTHSLEPLPQEPEPMTLKSSETMEMDFRRSGT